MDVEDENMELPQQTEILEAAGLQTGHQKEKHYGQKQSFSGGLSKRFS